MNFPYLTFLLPALGYLLLATLRTWLTENVAAIIGVGSACGRRTWLRCWPVSSSWPDNPRRGQTKVAGG